MRETEIGSRAARTALACILSIAALLFPACSHEMPEEIITSEQATVPELTTVSEETTAAETEPVEEDGYPVLVNDERFTASPESIICLSEPLTGIICELGAADRLRARSSYCTRDELSELPDAGKPSDPDTEVIVKIHPDVLITATSVSGTLRTRLEEYGITVLYISAPRSVDALESIYTCLGVMLYGSEEGAVKSEEAFSPVKTAFADIPGKPLGNTLYITEGLSAAGEDTFESSVLSFFGEPLIKTSGYVPKEQLSELLDGVQPDTVAVNSLYTYNDLVSDSFFSTLGAVKENRIIFIDNIYFEEPDGSVAELPELIMTKCAELGLTGG